jgi:hypothetical protein
MTKNKLNILLFYVNGAYFVIFGLWTIILAPADPQKQLVVS